MEISEHQALAEFEESGGLAALSADLLALSTQVEPCMGEGDEPSIDIRLRYHSGLWYLYSGDSSYDQDHRGCWGASCVTASMDADDAKSVAAELLDQVLEDMASCQ